MKTKPQFQEHVREHCARWLLLLTMVHTIPVLWITPVSASTVPAIALLAYGLASLLTFTREGMALGLMALVPSLVFCGLAWVMAWVLTWLLGKVFVRRRHPGGELRGLRALRASALAIFVAAPLLMVYFPVYVAGGHNSSSNVDLINLVDNTLSVGVMVGYWIALHVVLALLYAGYLLRDGHPLIATIERWSKPVLRAAAVALAGAALYGYYPVLVCRPLAELGSSRAELCVARTIGRDQRYWYERAAEHGELEAIAWLVDHTPNRAHRLRWLRMGAEEGDPAVQFALYEHMLKSDGPSTEADHWLRQAAEGDHPPAQMVLVDRLSREIHRSRSREQLDERNAWLDRAAALGSRMAKLRLAQHYTNGSMGYPADLKRARVYVVELADGAERTAYERTLVLDAAYYQQHLQELDAWSQGLEDGDPTVKKAMAERYLRSQLPGPGVAERGLELMERLAAGGDEDARDELIVSLRTGSGGMAKDTDRAMTWLINAAESGDPKAMERLASNYMSGREGFAVDYPAARHWIDAHIRFIEASDDQAAQSHIRKLRNHLAYIDRLGGYAGEPLLGASDLGQLGRRTDAQSQYRYAQQLLAGHGSKRRAEAIAQLEAAAAQGHGGAAWRLFQIYERGFPQEIDPAAALRMLELAVASHHFDASKELAMSYEHGKRGAVNLPEAVALYEETLAAGRDNRYGWDLDPDNFNHFRWLESRLNQARRKLDSQTRPADGAEDA